MVSGSKGAQQNGTDSKSDDRKIKTYTKEERWATGKGWGPGGKGCIVPKKKSQWITQEEYDAIQFRAVTDAVSGPPKRPKASEKFDWKKFLSNSKDPMIADYLVREPAELIDFNGCETCSETAGELELHWKEEKRRQEKYASLWQEKQSCKGRVPLKLRQAILRCIKDKKDVQDSIHRLTKWLENDASHLIRKHQLCMKASSRFDFIDSPFVGVLTGYVYDNLQEGVGYYKSDVEASGKIEIKQVDNVEWGIAEVLKQADCNRAEAIDALKGTHYYGQAVQILKKKKKQSNRNKLSK